jgi:hypothetical protein
MHSGLALEPGKRTDCKRLTGYASFSSPPTWELDADAKLAFDAVFKNPALIAPASEIRKWGGMWQRLGQRRD